MTGKLPETPVHDLVDGLFFCCGDHTTRNSCEEAANSAPNCVNEIFFNRRVIRLVSDQIIVVLERVDGLTRKRRKESCGDSTSTDVERNGQVTKPLKINNILCFFAKKRKEVKQNAGFQHSHF